MAFAKGVSGNPSGRPKGAAGLPASSEETPVSPQLSPDSDAQARAPGRWTPGRSGNPTGRPRGAAGLARYVQEQTNGGTELIDRLLELSRNKTNIREAMAATEALLARGFGKSLQFEAIGIGTADNTLDLGSLAPAKYHALQVALAERLLPAPDDTEHQ